MFFQLDFDESISRTMAGKFACRSFSLTDLNSFVFSSIQRVISSESFGRCVNSRHRLGSRSHIRTLYETHQGTEIAAKSCQSGTRIPAANEIGTATWSDIPFEVRHFAVQGPNRLTEIPFTVTLPGRFQLLSKPPRLRSCSADLLQTFIALHGNQKLLFKIRCRRLDARVHLHCQRLCVALSIDS